MINNHVKLSKFIRKCTKNVWYNASYGRITFNYRFISLCDIEEHYNGDVLSAKVNLEIEVIESPFTHRTWYSSIKERENKIIRQMFYYRENTDLISMLKFFSVDTRHLSVKSIKRKTTNVK